MFCELFYDKKIYLENTVASSSDPYHQALDIMINTESDLPLINYSHEYILLTSMSPQINIFFLHMTGWRPYSNRHIICFKCVERCIALLYFKFVHVVVFKPSKFLF